MDDFIVFLFYFYFSSSSLQQPHMVAPGGIQQQPQMRMISPGAPQHARMPGAVPMMQPPIPAGHLANLERSASNAGMQ
jgi:hypothetical protein